MNIFTSNHDLPAPLFYGILELQMILAQRVSGLVGAETRSDEELSEIFQYNLYFVVKSF